MASIAKRPDGQWRARYRDAAGREHSRHFARKVDAQRWLDEVTAAVVRGDYVDPRSGRRTFASYASEWLSAQPLRPTSYRSYESYLRNRISPALGAQPLNRITRTRVLALARSLEADGLAENTVRHIMSLVSSIFRGAVADGIIAKSPCADTVPRKPARKKLEPLTVAEVEALIEAAPERYRAMVVLAAGCGLRVGEVLGLKVRRVRFLERELDVVEQLQVIPGRRPYLAPPKTRSSVRTVPLPDVVATALARHLERYPGTPDDLIFRSRTGAPVWPNTFHNSVWQPLRRRAGSLAGTHHSR